MKAALAARDREFFNLVKSRILANPFSDERTAIDLKITGMAKNTPQDRLVAALAEKVHKRIKDAENKGIRAIQSFTGADRKLIEYTFLFDFFHQFLERFDNIIPEQIREGETSIRIPFTRDALSYLSDRGFSLKTSLRYFAICYQLRRAFYFIDRTLVGRSSCMKDLRRNLWNNVFTHDIGLYDDHLWNRMEDFSTLILGETGTGKGTAANAIGRSGYIPFNEKKQAFEESFARSFISLNLSQFPETLIESELFGHRKGAFTGAVEDYRGVFDCCSAYGSIFLDEIGEVSVPVQIKLLRVLQERTFTPVGSHENRRFRGRVIAATNRGLDDIRGRKILRDDLYYRLCSDVITVPPLQQRIREDPAELDDLSAHTVERLMGYPATDLTGMILNAIADSPGTDYSWPGNVRELEQCIRRILLKKHYEGDVRQESRDQTKTCDSATPSPHSLPERLMAGMEKGTLNAQDLTAGYCFWLYEKLGAYEAVARRTGLDRRTVKKYVLHWQDEM